MINFITYKQKKKALKQRSVNFCDSNFCKQGERVLILNFNSLIMENSAFVLFFLKEKFRQAVKHDYNKSLFYI